MGRYLIVLGVLCSVTGLALLTLNVRTQTVRYAVLDRPYHLDGYPGMGYSDHARFILHFRNTAYLFGDHDGRTLVTEILTSGFMFRNRLLQTSEGAGGG